MLASAEAWTYPVIANEDVRVVDRLFVEANALARSATIEPQDPPEFSAWLKTLREAHHGSDEWEDALFAVTDYFGLSIDG